MSGAAPPPNVEGRSPRSTMDPIVDNSSSVPTLISAAEPPHAIVSVNAAWTRLCGYAEEEAIGKTPAELLHSDATDKAVAAAFTKALSNTGRATATLTNRSKAGATFTHRITGSRYHDGEADRFVVVSTEVQLHTNPVKARRNGIVGLIILAALTLCPLAILLPARSPSTAVGSRYTADEPVRGHISWLDPVRMRVARDVPRRRTPSWKLAGRREDEQAGDAALSRKQPAARGGRLLGQVASFGGFVAAATVANLDLLLIFGGGAIVSGL